MKKESNDFGESKLFNISEAPDPSPDPVDRHLQLSTPDPLQSSSSVLLHRQSTASVHGYRCIWLGLFFTFLIAAHPLEVNSIDLNDLIQTPTPDLSNFKQSHSNFSDSNLNDSDFSHRFSNGDPVVVWTTGVGPSPREIYPIGVVPLCDLTGVVPRRRSESLFDRLRGSWIVEFPKLKIRFDQNIPTANQDEPVEICATSISDKMAQQLVRDSNFMISIS